MQSVESYIIDEGCEQFSQLPELDGHLGSLVFKSLAGRPFQPLIVDLSSGRKEMKAGLFLAAAIAISRRLRKIPSRRVGVVFPSGIACSLTNLALALVDKVPVNINFTSGRKSISSSISRAEITHIVTAKPMMEKLPDFPWTSETVDFQQLLKKISKVEILYWYGLVISTPAPLLMHWLGVPQKGGRREAAILFSSGSTGEPKGVVLSHRNIICNCLQIEKIGLFRQNDVIMANLPIFHSFGFTVTMWFPMIRLIRTVCLPNPLETRRVAQAVYDEKITFLIGTPSLLRPYIKKVEPALLKTLRVTAAGAEKTPAGFAALWENTFGCKYIVGYGITETSPVVAAELSPFDPENPGAGAKTTGSIFPGMQACIVDDTTGNVIDPTSQGVIYFRGANVFDGYLDDPEATNRALSNGWFRTGDIGRFDEKGNLHIEGRISRFSKIGGEMVPHGTVEQAVVSAYHFEDSEAPMVAITGATDDAKGECLVLFTAFDVNASDLREKLAAQGIPNLWIPRRIRRVEKIPCLASGKLDLAMLKRIAEEPAAAEEEAV
jgi:acyl-[acyl-carrier-protein]-phospholipid O-acyltransferase / long-chain-fatty-acid--[acyl-carrier-protein] ligase